MAMSLSAKRTLEKMAMGTSTKRTFILQIKVQGMTKTSPRIPINIRSIRKTGIFTPFSINDRDGFFCLHPYRINYL